MHDFFVLDPLATLTKLVICLVAAFSFLYGHHYLAARNMLETEYYTLGLFSVLGMMVMVSATNMISMYLGLELLSLPLYAMVAMRQDASDAPEAAMKYFVMGALASAMLLYGLSMWYAVTGSFDFHEMALKLTAAQVSGQLLPVFGLVLVIAGIAFKFGAAPFHLWAPDVYQGAPTPVTLFISGAPKIAVWVFAWRLLAQVAPGLQIAWVDLLTILAVASMALGNIGAILQTNIKRMLAYSSIAHMGYMLLGFIAATPSGYAASLFYVITYVFMSIGAFAVLLLLGYVDYDIELVDDLRGLNKRDPWLAFLLLLIMFSMAGIPPAVGFFAKLGVLEALVASHHIVLAGMALIFAIIGAYYYLRVVKAMYFEAPENPLPIVRQLDVRWGITINGVAVLLVGMFPSALVVICRNVFVGA